MEVRDAKDNTLYDGNVNFNSLMDVPELLQEPQIVKVSSNERNFMRLSVREVEKN